MGLAGTGAAYDEAVQPFDSVTAAAPLAARGAVRLIDDGEPRGRSSGVEPDDPAQLILVCANCGARMDERTCKLTCSCGYFLSCSDDY